MFQAHEPCLAGLGPFYSLPAAGPFLSPVHGRTQSTGPPTAANPSRVSSTSPRVPLNLSADMVRIVGGRGRMSSTAAPATKRETTRHQPCGAFRWSNHQQMPAASRIHRLPSDDSLLRPTIPTISVAVKDSDGFTGNFT